MNAMIDRTHAMAEEIRRDVHTGLLAIDWKGISVDLDAQGWAVLPKLLAANECAAVAGLYAADEGFRSRVVMARHGFGRGEYRYFPIRCRPWSRACEPLSIHS